jgi:hypothetical protein
LIIELGLLINYFKQLLNVAFLFVMGVALILIGIVAIIARKKIIDDDIERESLHLGRFFPALKKMR